MLEENRCEMIKGKISGSELEIVSFDANGTGQFVAKVDGKEVRGFFQKNGTEFRYTTEQSNRCFYITRSTATEDDSRPLYRVMDVNTSTVWDGLRVQGKAELLLGQNSKNQKKGQKVKAQMPGKVVKINVSSSMNVKKDQSVLVLEAMKMENEIRSPIDGVIMNLKLKPGDLVETGAELFTIEKV